MTEMQKLIKVISLQNLQKKFDFNKIYTSSQIVKKIGVRAFQELFTNGRLTWITDNSFGLKLYRFNI